MNDKQWFEKENFWLNYGPIMFDAHHWAEAPGIARAICEMCQLPPGSRILDAGCGPGRITVELALQGMEVTGVDIIGPYLEAAQETAADEGVSITTVQADLRSFQPRLPCSCLGGMRGGMFSALISVFSTTVRPRCMALMLRAQQSARMMRSVLS